MDICSSAYPFLRSFSAKLGSSLAEHHRNLLGDGCWWTTRDRCLLDIRPFFPSLLTLGTVTFERLLNHRSNTLLGQEIVKLHLRSRIGEHPVRLFLADLLPFKKPIHAS